MGESSDLPDSDRCSSIATNNVAAVNTPTSNSTLTNTILPPNSTKSTHNQSGGLDEKADGQHEFPFKASYTHRDGKVAEGLNGREGDGVFISNGADIDGTQCAADKSSVLPLAAPALEKSEDAGVGDAAVEAAENKLAKQPITTRLFMGCKRFFAHMWAALFHSWINVLLVFVPVGIVADAVGLSPGIVFAMNAIAIVPLAGLLSFATEAVAARLGDTLGALLNVSFGNAVELIIFIIALVKDEVEIVQASLLGSILANLLLILGMAFLLGGLRYREQVYNSTATQMSAVLLSLSVMSLLLPVSSTHLFIRCCHAHSHPQTAFHASFASTSATLADSSVLKVSRGVSVVLLFVYGLYLLFQLKSHAYMYESTPQAIIDEESHPGVLADFINSSSSSDDSSSASSTDSDSSGSGSVANAGRKLKRVFKNRRRRGNSASTSSTTGSAKQSALSSPSTEQGSYFANNAQSRRESTIAALPFESAADADYEDNVSSQPRVRDFMDEQVTNGEAPKSPDRKKRQKKKPKKHQKKKRQQEGSANSAADGAGMPVSDTPNVPSNSKPESPKAVGFSENVAVYDAPASGGVNAKGPFNMRQLRRPALPKMLSNNVFVNPPPVVTPSTRPNLPARRAVSMGMGVRRTSSLPDRLNQQVSGNRSQASISAVRSEPLPPFQHQRTALRAPNLEIAGPDGINQEAEVKPQMSRTSAVVLLLCTTALVAVCAEFMVSAIPEMIKSSPSIGQAFIGLIILPIVGNAAEHVTAVTVAAKNKMDLAIGVAVGSSIQIALFVTPVVVLLGWILQTDMSLYFNLFETISLFVTVFVVNFLVLDGRSNYLEGSLLIAAYIIIAVGAFFYPNAQDQSQFGGGEG